MKKATWRKHHKWLGLVLGFFLIMFCISGVMLNHPALITQYSISRAYLPKDYEYKKWDKGLLRGTLKWNNHVIVYGYNGLWLTDSLGQHFSDFNRGLPTDADARNIRGIAETPSHQLFMASQYELYTLTSHHTWKKIPLSNGEEERLSDITTKGDSLIVTSRSYIYLLVKPYQTYQKITLEKPTNYDGKVSLFSTVWQLHSGALFGFVGKLIADGIGLTLVFLTISGFVFWLILKRKRQGSSKLASRWLRWHNYIGRISIALTLFLCFTGWLLRPPALIAIASARVPAVPFSTMDTDNPWNDGLRALRYDRVKKGWLLYTSEGFYAIKDLMAAPTPVLHHPPVSVMGVNVMQQTAHGVWLIGSFSGMYEWDRQHGTLIDHFTHQAAQPTKGIPFGTHAVAGYSHDFTCGEVIADYKTGCDNLPQPHWMATLPMSLRNVCIEIHTGRIYTFLGMGTIVYIFIIGLGIAWCLWSGWKISKSGNRRSVKRT